MSTIDWNIIKKSLVETMTPEEQQALNEWLAISSENRELYNDAKSYYRGDISKIDLSDKELNNRWTLFLKTKRARRRSLMGALSAAAAIIGVIITLSTYFNIEDTDFNTKNNLAESGVTFQMEGGETTNLSGDAKLIITRDGVKEIYKDSDKQHKTIKLQSSIRYAITSTKNEIYSMTLEDGTKVWLNRNSKIRFPLTFSSDVREVTIEGEAYFEVAHNAVKPFIVSSNRASVKVLGTKFNFVAGDHNSFSSTTLVDGSVEMTIKSNNEKVLLTPGTQGEEKNGTITIKKVDVTTLTAWTINKLILKDATVEDIAQALKIKYGVEVIISDKIDKSTRYSLYTDLNNSMSDVINAIKRIEDIDVEVVDSNIIVLKKK